MRATREGPTGHETLPGCGHQVASFPERLESFSQSGKLVRWRLGQRATTVLSLSVGVPKIDSYTIIHGLVCPSDIARSAW